MFRNSQLIWFTLSGRAEGDLVDCVTGGSCTWSACTLLRAVVVASAVVRAA
jgi:hypothetical protein